MHDSVQKVEHICIESQPQNKLNAHRNWWAFLPRTPNTYRLKKSIDVIFFSALKHYWSSPHIRLRIFSTYFRNTNFDIDKARAIAELFRGTHDFRTFMGAMQQNSERDHAFFTMRNISDISISSSEAVCTTFAKDCAQTKYNYWNIEITGRSFLYRQVSSTHSLSQ